mgnify:CR=1 FL=1
MAVNEKIDRDAQFITGHQNNVTNRIISEVDRAVSFHPVPLAMARVVFLCRKKFDERFQSNVTFLFSKTK